MRNFRLVSWVDNWEVWVDDNGYDYERFNTTRTEEERWRLKLEGKELQMFITHHDLLDTAEKWNEHIEMFREKYKDIKYDRLTYEQFHHNHNLTREERSQGKEIGYTHE